MSEPTTGVLGALGLNPILFLAQLINFGLVVFVVWKWVYKPLLRVMDERARKIASGLNDAELARQQLADAENQHKSIVQDARKESQALIDEARQGAEQEKQRIMTEAQASLEQQLTDARERLKREKELIIGAVKHEVAGLVVMATEKVAAGSVDPSKQHELVKQAIDEIEAEAV